MSSHYFSCQSHVVPSQHIREYYESTASFQEEKLSLAVKQYTPLDNAKPREGDVTIIAFHGNGMPKELYEPLFDELYTQSRASNDGFRIRNIWIAAVSTHGESAMLNAGKLGIDVCWNDHARDLLHMINVFREEMTLPLVGIGHSMGGTQLVQLSLLHPRLFSAIVCVEAVLNKTMTEMRFTATYPLTLRRDVWASREEAVAASRKNPMVRAFDPRVFERWVQYAFHDLPTALYPTAPAEIQAKADNQGTTPVTFATTRHHEVRGFARPKYPPSTQALDTFEPSADHPELTKDVDREINHPFYRPEPFIAFQQLPFLRPPCLYLYGEKSTYASASPQGRMDKLVATGTAPGGSGGVAAGRVADGIVTGGGHFIVFDNPTGLAAKLLPWLQSEIRKWKENDRKQRAAWMQVPLERKETVNDDWYVWQKRAHGDKPKPRTSTKQSEIRMSKL